MKMKHCNRKKIINVSCPSHSAVDAHRVQKFFIYETNDGNTYSEIAYDSTTDQVICCYLLNEKLGALMH